MSIIRLFARRLYYTIKELPYLIKIILPFRNHSEILTYKDAWGVLNKNGYEQKELFEEIPSLAPSDIDLSIVVPVYNSEKFLENCLNSLLNQSTNYTFEVICINDGSTDGSLDILNRLSKRHRNLRYSSQQNQGISAARNAGIVLAKGRYIGFVDNDDLVTNDYVERILSTGYKYNADLVQTGHDILYPDGKLKESRVCEDCVIECSDTVNIINKTKGYIWGGCLKKELFLEMRFPLGFWYEDMVASLLYVRKANRIALISSPLYKYLWYGGNASATLWKGSNIKSVDQFWLAYQCAEFSINKLRLPVDDVFMAFLLREWSSALLNRTMCLNEEVHKAVFSLASNYLKKIKYHYSPTGYYKKQIYNAFLTGNYYLWKNASIAMSYHNA